MPLRRLVSLTLFLLLCLLSMEKHAEAGAQASGFAAMPTCRRRCGAVEVPFPFGFQDDDPRCFYFDAAGSFTVTCNASFTPPKAFAGGFEVIDISIPNAKMRTWMDISYDCYNDTGPSDSSNWSMYMGDETSTVSSTDNIFVAVGCDTKASIEGVTRSEYVGDIRSATYTGGCMSSCGSLDDVDGDCSGIGCCQTSIPKNIRGYNITIESSQNHRKVLDFNPCSYSFLVEEKNYTFRASDLRNMSTTRLFPIVLDWYVGNQSCELAKKNHTSYACISNNSDCVNSTNGPGYVCRCSPGYEGNPYVSGGCKDIDECKYPGPCRSDAICTNKPGNYTCQCPSGTFGDGLTYCIPDKKSNMSAALGT